MLTVILPTLYPRVLRQGRTMRRRRKMNRKRRRNRRRGNRKRRIRFGLGNEFNIELEVEVAFFFFFLSTYFWGGKGMEFRHQSFQA